MNRKTTITFIGIVLLIFSIHSTIIYFNWFSEDFQAFLNVFSSSLLTVSIAYIVALIQIDSQKKERQTLQYKANINAISLLTKEIEFNHQVLKQIISEDTTTSSTDIEDFLSPRIKTTVWESVSLNLFSELDEDKFETVIDLYYDLYTIALPKSFNRELALQIITLSITSKAELQIILNEFKKLI